MKISVVIGSVIVAIIAVTVVVALINSTDETNQDVLRVAFFPSIGHAVPIIGLENGIFQEKIGKEI